MFTPDYLLTLGGVIAGLMLGWVWLTREEGLWLAPGLAILVAGGLYRAVVERGVLRFPTAALVALATFGAVNAGLRAINVAVFDAANRPS